jgi:hypothetical protein
MRLLSTADNLCYRLSNLIKDDIKRDVNLYKELFLKIFKNNVQYLRVTNLLSPNPSNQYSK